MIMSINEFKLQLESIYTDIKNFITDKKFINPKSKNFFYHGTKISPDKFVLRHDYNGEDSSGWSGDLYMNDEHFGFWEKFEDSMKSVLIIKGTKRMTIITDIDNVIPRIDLAKEFYKII